MKSFDIKFYCLRWLLYQKNCPGAFTESINNSDVFGITENLFGVEIETKRDRTDLKNELHEIYNVINTHPSNIPTKGTKHSIYIKKVNNPIKPIFIPRYFYIAVPEELSSIAKQGIKGTPYGLLVAYDRGHIIIKEEVKPRKNSEDKIGDKELLRLIKKTSFENFGLREKLLAVNMR